MAYADFDDATGVLPALIILSFIIASSLSVYPLSPSMAALRPMVMVMVLILFQRRFVVISLAFAIGIIADLLMDTHLGQQAFAAVMVAMVIKITSIYIRQLNTISAWLIASLGLVVFQVSLWILQLFIQNTFVAQSALSLFMSIISWPLVLLALRRFAR